MVLSTEISWYTGLKTTQFGLFSNQVLVKYWTEHTLGYLNK